MPWSTLVLMIKFNQIFMSRKFILTYLLIKIGKYQKLNYIRIKDTKFEVARRL
jgi:hypothetical protein